MFKGLTSLFGSTAAGPSTERDAPDASPGPSRSRVRSPFQTTSTSAGKTDNATDAEDELMSGEDEQEDDSDREDADSRQDNNNTIEQDEQDDELDDGAQEEDSIDEDDSPAAAIKAGKRKRRVSSSSQQQNAAAKPRTGKGRRSSRLSAPTVDSSSEDGEDDGGEEEEDLPPRKRTSRRASLAAQEKMEQAKIKKEEKKQRRAKRREAKRAKAETGSEGTRAKRRKRVETPVEEDVDDEDDAPAAAEEDDELPDPYAGSAAQPGAPAAAHYSDDEPAWVETYVHLENSDIALLENPETGKVFPRIRLEPGRGPINMGEVVKLRPSGGADSWLGVVEKIASKRDTLKEYEGTRESTFIGLQLSWLYSQQDFRDLEKQSAAWSGPIKSMGPNERVKTQHTDWNHQSMILSAEPELVYVFDDSYPAAPPNWEEPSPHPLSFFSIDALQPLASSIYSWPALEHLPSQGRKPSPIVSRRKLPSYYFGVSAIAPEPEEGVELEDDFAEKPKRAKKLPGGKDGVAGIPYVRVAFSFKALPRIDQQEEEEVDELEGEAVGQEDLDEEYRGKEKKGKKGKGRASPKKPAKKKAPAKQVWPLAFSTHSTADKPYCPRNVQHYSRADEQWYDVDDLAAAKHTRPIPPADPSKPTPKPFSLALGARAFDSTSAPVREIVDRLADLAADKIVRGGAYGLTGNAYLVTQAGAVHDRLLEHEGLSYEPQDLAEARSLLDDAVAFREEVKRRSLGIQEAKGLGKEWRSLGDEKLPLGHEWVCPETGEAI